HADERRARRQVMSDVVDDRTEARTTQVPDHRHVGDDQQQGESPPRKAEVEEACKPRYEGRKTLGSEPRSGPCRVDPDCQLRGCWLRVGDHRWRLDHGDRLLETMK